MSANDPERTSHRASDLIMKRHSRRLRYCRYNAAVAFRRKWRIGSTGRTPMSEIKTEFLFRIALEVEV